MLWYGQCFGYGTGTTKMGEYSFAGWSIFMAAIIIFSNMWGLVLKEWKLVDRRDARVLVAGHPGADDFGHHDRRRRRFGSERLKASDRKEGRRLAGCLFGGTTGRVRSGPVPLGSTGSSHSVGFYRGASPSNAPIRRGRMR